MQAEQAMAEPVDPVVVAVVYSVAAAQIPVVQAQSVRGMMVVMVMPVLVREIVQAVVEVVLVPQVQ